MSLQQSLEAGGLWDRVLRTFSVLGSGTAVTLISLGFLFSVQNHCHANFAGFSVLCPEPLSSNFAGFSVLCPEPLSR